jgi:hypothetical protein
MGESISVPGRPQSGRNEGRSGHHAVPSFHVSAHVAADIALQWRAKP